MDLEEIKSNLRGPAIAMITPMKQNFDLDTEGIRALTRYLIDNGIKRGRGILMAATAIGEAPSLTTEERRSVMRIASEEAKEEATLATSVQHTSLREAIELAIYAQEVGYHCVQVSPPFYWNTSPDEVHRFVEAIADSIDIGIMIYNTTWLGVLSGAGVDEKLMGRLAGIENVISVKWSSPNWIWYTDIMRKFKDRFAFIDNNYSGLGVMFGAKGHLAGTGTFYPEYSLRVWELMEAGNYKEGIEELWKLKIPFYKWLREIQSAGVYGYHIKAATGMVGLPAGPARPPYNDVLNPQQLEKLKNILEGAGLTVK